MRKMKGIVLLSVAALLLASLRSMSANLLENGDFSDGIKGWNGGNYAGGRGCVGAASEGASDDERRFAKLVKSEGPGGAQLMQQVRLPDDAALLEFFFRAKGCPANVYVRFIEPDGKTPFRDSHENPASLKVVFNGAAEWQEISRTLKVPPSAKGNGGWVRVHFGILCGQVENVLLIDDVSLVARKDERPEEACSLEFKFAPTPPADNSYRPVDPVEDFTFELKDGLILRNGEPHFWVGTGNDLGSGQTTPAGLWLARLQGQEFAAIAGDPDWSGKLDGDELTFSIARNSPGFIAWIREAERLGFIAQPTVTSRYFKWSGLRKFTKDHPDFADIHYDAGHYLSLDTGHPVGRRLLAEKRKGLLAQHKDDRRFLFEFAREPGSEPGNLRVKSSFVAWAKAKYGDIGAANAAWNTSYRDWTQVAPPHLPEDIIYSGGEVRKIELRNWALENRMEMYYDWLMFVQEDTARSLAGEVADVRAFAPSVPIGFDVRGHRSDSDGYMAYLPAAVDRLVDVFEIHDQYRPFYYRNSPYNLRVLRVSSSFQLFKYNFFRANATKPLWNSEDIVSTVASADSSPDAMAKNDLGKLMGEAWEFRRDGDAEWDLIPVPAAWDALEKWKGYSGTAWYRRHFTIAARYADDYADGSRKFYFFGKGIAQEGTVWLNGHEVGHVKGWATPFKLDVGRYLKFGGDNEILIRAEGKGGFLNGLRGYYHILPQDMVSESIPFGEKQYKAMLWMYFMHGSSAVSVWNWGSDIYRPYFPELIARINECARRVQPALRRQVRGKVAMLYPYLFARGLPFAPFVELDAVREDWFNALVFNGCEPDILSEETLWTRLDAKTYPVLFAPQCDIVKDRTWEKVKEYLAQGGRLVMTEGSFARTFGRYAATDIAAQPNVTKLSERLEMEALQSEFRPILPEDDFPLTVEADGENPLLHKVLAGNGEFAFLYLHNWGGMDKRVSFALPQEYAGWKFVPMEGVFEKSGGGWRTVVPSQAPVVALLAKDAAYSYVAPPDALDRASELRRLEGLYHSKATGDRPKALFFKSTTFVDGRVGAEVYPEICAAIRAAGYDIENVPGAEWTPEKLREYSLIVVPETASAHIRPTLQNEQAMAALVDWVKDGGRLFCPVYSSYTRNANGEVVRKGYLRPLGVDGFGAGASDSRNFAFGDVHQPVTDNINHEHPIGAGVRYVSLYVDAAIRLTKDSTLKPVVSFRSDAEGKGAGSPTVVAGEVGKGRVVVTSDVMLFQPYRIGEADNAKLLGNIVNWLVK